MSQWERLVLRLLSTGPYSTRGILDHYRVPYRRNVGAVVAVCERLQERGVIDRTRSGGTVVWYMFSENTVAA